MFVHAARPAPRRLALPLLVLLTWAGAAAAVDDETGSPPKPSETTTTCERGKIWDQRTKTCIAPEDTRLHDDTRYRAVRELSHAGRYPEARRVLDSMSDPQEDRVLTYLGFLSRKTGDRAAGMDYYRQALQRNPDNLLARAYMGMAHAEAGETRAARRQLQEIRARGGTGGWPETALRAAIDGNSPYSY